MALSDTQLILLSTASQREDLLVTVPPHPRPGAARISLSKLLSQGLLEEVTVGREQLHWSTDDEGRSTGLRITRAGLEAIGLEPEGKPALNESTSCTSRPIPSQESVAPVESPPAPGDGSKQALVISLLRRREGQVSASLRPPRVGCRTPPGQP